MLEIKRIKLKSWQLWTIGIFLFLLIFPFIVKLLVNLGEPYTGFSVITYRPVSLIFNSLKWGALYLSLAMGLTLYYKVFKFPNFALGEFFVIGGFVGIFLSTTEQFQSTQDDPSSTILYTSIIFAFILTGLVAVIIERLVYRRLRENKSTPQTMMITSLGISLILRSFIGMRYAGRKYRYETTQKNGIGLSVPDFQIRIPLRSEPVTVEFMSGGSPIRFNFLGIQVIQISTIIGLVILLFLMLKWTKWGKAIRAVASNPDLAASSGIDVERIYLLTAFMVGGLAGVGGSLYAAVFRIDIADALILLLPAFAVLVLGSVGSVMGAFIGAFIVGFARIYSEPILSGLQGPLERNTLFNFNEVIPFVVLIIVLLVNPRGIGTKLEEKFNAA